jgi:hypothetical protein
MNVAASVHHRLLDYSRTEGLRFNAILQRYGLERWLYRLSISPHADRFVLKGALMLTAWDLPKSERRSGCVKQLSQCQGCRHNIVLQ